MDRESYRAAQKVKVEKKFYRIHRPGIIERATKLLYQYCAITHMSPNDAWIKELAPLTRDEVKLVRSTVMEMGTLKEQNDT